MSNPGDFHKGWVRRGSRQPQAKLNEERVFRIRQMLKDGAARKSVAQQFKVSETTIDRIARGETWTHVKL